MMCLEETFSSGYIRTRKAHHGLTKLTLKHDRTFGLFDRFGDISTDDNWELGVYHAGTRVLSQFDVRINGEPPLFLSSNVGRDNVLLKVDLTNPDFYAENDGESALARGAVHFGRRILLFEGRCEQEFSWQSFADEPIELTVSIRFAADFADLFEVRGLVRERRGIQTIDCSQKRQVSFRYVGLDQVERLTCLTFSSAPELICEDHARLRIRIEPHQRVSQYVTATFEGSDRCEPTLATFDGSLKELRRRHKLDRETACTISSSNERVNDALERADADLKMLRTNTAHGPFPFAGTPWFSTVFGRDGIWTALFCNWFDPAMSRGVLSVLAESQSKVSAPDHEADPGKILHEMREGEMATLGEVPFGRYYGSVDSTPLFVMLADAYITRTRDLAACKTLWPHVRAAIDWINSHGDRDGDGFVEYFRELPQGLSNQGWKDSHDSISHGDGSLATGPIALCEVQAYVYAAKLGAARLADRLERSEEAIALRASAETLRIRFEDAFWSDALGTYALALDGEKRRCEVVTSNVGHVLFCGLASPERAAATVRRLMEPSMFSGWGIRTMSIGTARFNPMSYHNGSVWPHDSAIVASGFARYGFKAEAASVTTALFEAASHMDQTRLPELFCGFTREDHAAPTLYPVACTPQAWSSAALFSLMQCCLGVQLDAWQNRATLVEPVLPGIVDEVEVRNLAITGSTVDLVLERGHRSVTVDALRRSGDVDVLVNI